MMMVAGRGSKRSAIKSKIATNHAQSPYPLRKSIDPLSENRIINWSPQIKNEIKTKAARKTNNKNRRMRME
jgi:hypothetical protein